MVTIRTTEQRAPTMAEQAKGAEVQDRIVRRAYELYEQRGRQEGQDLEDWLKAEQQLAGSSSR